MSNLGDLIAHHEQLREEKRMLNERLKALNNDIFHSESAVLEALDTAGLEHARVAGTSVSVTEQTMPNVTDWEQLYDFIKQHDAMYMLQRRVSTGPYREMLQMEQEVPGVEPYVQRKVNMRAN
ncbi:gp33 family protein [Vreelandella jeotgali]|uniref:gp33 family protein n=1 Tax=Vreelandella jeotgali TaxID=553386 RepID=UPI00034CE242|nr:hypothetical protein [Halomonas jeotgali]